MLVHRSHFYPIAAKGLSISRLNLAADPAPRLSLKPRPRPSRPATSTLALCALTRLMSCARVRPMLTPTRSPTSRAGRTELS